MGGNSLTRRRLLAGTATAAAAGLAGCTGGRTLQRFNPFWDPPITMKVIAASGDETDVKCVLPEEAVEKHVPLKNAMRSLADADAGERVVKGLSTDTGRAISDTLTQQCENVGGLYRYEGRWYLVGLTFKAQDDHQEYHDDQGEDHEHGGSPTATETPSN